MNGRRPNLPALQAECDRFNAKCPVVGAVIVKNEFSGETLSTFTTSPAQVLSGHMAVVWLKDVRGCYQLDRVTPVGGAA